MGTVKMHSGRPIVAYRDGAAIDFNGEVIPGAPKQPADTDPSQQLAAPGGATPEERMGLAIANALQGKSPVGANGAAKSAASEGDGGGEEVPELPTLADLPKALKKAKSVDEVKAMQAADERAGATKLYEARLAELAEK